MNMNLTQPFTGIPVSAIGGNSMTSQDEKNLKESDKAPREDSGIKYRPPVGTSMEDRITTGEHPFAKANQFHTRTETDRSAHENKIKVRIDGHVTGQLNSDEIKRQLQLMEEAKGADFKEAEKTERSIPAPSELQKGGLTPPKKEILSAKEALAEMGEELAPDKTSKPDHIRPVCNVCDCKENKSSDKFCAGCDGAFMENGKTEEPVATDSNNEPLKLPKGSYLRSPCNLCGEEKNSSDSKHCIGCGGVFGKHGETETKETPSLEPVPLDASTSGPHTTLDPLTRAEAMGEFGKTSDTWTSEQIGPVLERVLDDIEANKENELSLNIPDERTVVPVSKAVTGVHVAMERPTRKELREKRPPIEKLSDLEPIEVTSGEIQGVKVKIVQLNETTELDFDMAEVVMEPVEEPKPKKLSRKERRLKRRAEKIALKREKTKHLALVAPESPPVKTERETVVESVTVPKEPEQEPTLQEKIRVDINRRTQSMTMPVVSRDPPKRSSGPLIALGFLVFACVIVGSGLLIVITNTPSGKDPLVIADNGPKEQIEDSVIVPVDDQKDVSMEEDTFTFEDTDPDMPSTTATPTTCVLWNPKTQREGISFGKSGKILTLSVKCKSNGNTHMCETPADTRDSFINCERL